MGGGGGRSWTDDERNTLFRLVRPYVKTYKLGRLAEKGKICYQDVPWKQVLQEHRKVTPADYEARGKLACLTILRRTLASWRHGTVIFDLCLDN